MFPASKHAGMVVLEMKTTDEAGLNLKPASFNFRYVYFDPTIGFYDDWFQLPVNWHSACIVVIYSFVRSGFYIVK